jgi:hypothetical protein
VRVYDSFVVAPFTFSIQIGHGYRAQLSDSLGGATWPVKAAQPKAQQLARCMRVRVFAALSSLWGTRGGWQHLRCKGAGGAQPVQGSLLHGWLTGWLL